MPWELTAVKYDGAPPQYTREIDSARQLPLGPCDTVREWISSALPGIAWSREPSLAETSCRLGMELPDCWDEDTRRLAAMSKWRGQFGSENLFVEMYGLYDGADIRSFEIEVRGTADPIPCLQKLCEKPKWTLAEVGKDGQCLEFDSNASRRWNDFRNWVEDAVDHLQSDDSE